MVDKTGTLTEGKPRLVTVVPHPPLDETTLLRLAASLESVSEHPLAEAIVAGARERNIGLFPVRQFSSTTGKGVSGRVEGRLVAIGNLRYLEGLRVDPGLLRAQVEELRLAGQTVMFVVSTAGLPASSASRIP